MSAYDFVARALASQAAASSGLTFTQLGRASLPMSRIDSSGYAAAGLGHGTYVADEFADQALHEAHPEAVFIGAGDRYFRLAGDERGFVTPEQFGCPLYAPGINQQPFIQAAVAYAEAVGLNGVLFAQPRYELWAPVRPDGLGVDGAGSYIALSRSIALIGSGPARVVLDCRNSQGGRNDAVTQTVAIPDWSEVGKEENPWIGQAIQPWIGHAIYVDPAVPAIDDLRIENLEVDCTVTYDRGNRDNASASNCGLFLGDNVGSVRLRDVTIRNCAGFLYSFAGRTGVKEELLENCVFDGSPEGALRCGLAARGTYSNLQAGNAYCSQIFGGHGHSFLGGRFYDMEQVQVLGGAGGGANGCEDGMPDTYPLRAPASPVPSCLFQNVLAEAIGSFEVGPYARGVLRTIDTPVLLANYGKLEDVDLEIEAWADRRSDFDALSIQGPADLVTPVPRASAGTNFALPRNLKIRVRCHRTAEAVASGNAILCALRIGGGLLDEETVSFSLSGTACAAYDVTGTLPQEGANPQTHRGFAWPRIIVEEGFAPLDAEAFPNTATAEGAFTFALRPGPVNAVAPSAEGVHDMSLVNSFRFADGQRARIRHLGGGAAGECIVRVPQFGAGAQLPEDRHLFQKGDYIDLRWNASVARWAEDGYSTGQRLNLNGSLKLPDAIAVDAKAAAAINIPVPGATTNDQVTNVSWSGAVTGALQVSPSIATDDVVTVQLFNPDGSTTTTIPKGAVVQAFIRKVFGVKPAPQQTLGDLSLSSTAATAGQPWSATISGETAGSTITANSSDGAALTVTGNNVSGTFPSAGGQTVTLTETLVGAAKSPHSSTLEITVAEPAPVLAPLTLSGTSATAGSGWMATISGQTGGSTITASTSDGAALAVSGDTVSGTFLSAGSKTVTLTETLAGASNSPRSSTASVSVAAPAPSLGTLALSSTNAAAGSVWIATFTGRTAGSSITASSSDGTGLVVSGDRVSGTFDAAGDKTITLTETLAGATDSPRSSVASVTIAAPAPSLRVVTLKNVVATAGLPWTAAISGRTSGSSFAASSSDGTPLTVSGINVSGTFPTAGAKTITITETLAAASNSPRSSTVSLTVASPAPVLAPLTLGSTAAEAGAAWSTTISGRTSGSTITASSSDGTALTVSGDSVGGTFSASGSKTITLTETLTGASNSPQASTVSVAVAAPAIRMEAESTALLAAMKQAPSDKRKARVDQLIKRLKSGTDDGATASIWSKLDVFFMFAASDEQAALVDWKNPGSRAAKKVGAPVFTADQGYTGLATATDYLDLAYQPSADGGAQSLGIAQDDAHASLYALTEGKSSTGALSDGQRVNLRARSGSRAFIKLNSSGSTSLNDSGATPCSLTAVRGSATEQLAYRDGTLVATGTINSSGMPGAFTLLKSADQQVASVSIGKALTAKQVAEYHDARREYLEGIAADAGALENVQTPVQTPEPTPTPTPAPTPTPTPDTKPVQPSSPLPEAKNVPPTLIGPWEPVVKTGSRSATVTGTPEDHILLTGAQFSSQPSLGPIKVLDCAAVRAEGIDMGGYEIAMRGREHMSIVGVLSDNTGKPESDGSAIGCPGSDRPENPLEARPQVLYQYCRFVNFKGTDKNHYTSDGVDNVTKLVKVENLADRRFRFTLAAPFPEGIAPGKISPVRKVIVAETTHAPTGTNLPLQGNNWNYELDTAIDALTYEGVVQDLGDERWKADNRLVPQTGDVSTGGRMWLCKTVAGQHSDSMLQIEDGRPIGHLQIENCVTSGNYQVPGIIGSPGSPFHIRNLHTFKIFAAPQDPATQGLYVKGSEPGHFEDCYFELPFDRPVDRFSVYPRTEQALAEPTTSALSLVWTEGGQFTGRIIGGPPPVDFAPEKAIGVNWAGGNYPGRTVPTEGSLSDITLRLDTLSAGMAVGARVGVIDVVHSTQGEIIELEISGDTGNVAGVNAKADTKLIRRGLVVGSSKLASKATYTITITARLRSNPKIAIQKTFKIAVP